MRQQKLRKTVLLLSFFSAMTGLTIGLQAESTLQVVNQTKRNIYVENVKSVKSYLHHPPGLCKYTIGRSYGSAPMSNPEGLDPLRAGQSFTVHIPCLFESLTLELEKNGKSGGIVDVRNSGQRKEYKVGNVTLRLKVETTNTTNPADETKENKVILTIEE